MSLEEPEPESAALSREGYESLLDAAETYREALVVRCCGEVGLRPAELADVTPGAIDRVRTDPPRYLLRLSGSRVAYLPTSLERELRRYVRSNGISSDEPVFSVSARRLQMLVAEVAERAGERFDEPTLASVSTEDLRRYFLETALIDRGINPLVVKRVGGWSSFEALEPYLSSPTDDEIVEEFAAVEANPNPDSGGERTVSDGSVVRSLLTASDRCALVRLESDGYVDRWNRSAESTFGYSAGDIVGTHVSALYADEAVERGLPGRALTRALEESNYEGDDWFVREDGSRFRAVAVVTPLRDDRHRSRGFALLVCDVSQHHERLEAVRSDREDLERTSDVAARHRALTDALLEATSHEEVETATCTVLADGRTYDAAWIDRTTHSDRRGEWRTAGGLEADEVDRLVPDEWGEPRSSARDRRPNGTGVSESDDPGDGIAEATGTGAVAVATGIEATVADGSFAGRVAAVPVWYGDTVYGRLTVATERAAAFDETERAWLETIGRQVGYAVAAIRRRNLLLSDRVVELEFVCRDEDSFFVETSRRFDCRVELDSLVPLSDSTQLYYVRLEGASPADVFERAEAVPGIDDCRLIETYEDACRLEFVVEGSSPTLTLTEYGVTVREARFEEGTGTIVAECAADADIRTIVTGLRSAFPDSELAGKRETERPVQTGREFREGLEERLTDRQEAALRAAYSGGYYDWPRESTAEEIADAMGVSSPTLHSHLRKGQRELLRTFFDDPADE
ncbi:bacterio-opsin activator domain-containing protein [Natronococcus jeotgali]|uniref:PAS/PAC sensor protein n=1 Tax=Natronococcus jeotgali DSM 18795 TaxID=1227498 RepID=L9WTU2_9EURY|nr:bacterio-opsin activator domain-containing protein [Natronococcus jeotgali]ELY52884.1 PAS/PAC sensor protein [Natronococcus jeotgali DSM 18795]